MKIWVQPVRSRGFTLIEIVISAAIMALVLGASYACLNSGLISQRLVESRIDATQSGRAVLNMIAADLRAACPLSPDYDFLGMRRSVDDVDADNLDFGTHHYVPRKTRESDFCEMSYFLRQDERTGKFSLWRRIDASPDDQPLAGGRQEEIARGLAGLRFEYYDGFDWYDEWGDPNGKRRGRQASLLDPPNLTGLPEAVRITIWCDPHPETPKKENDDPPLMFQTVARLELAAIAYKRGSSSSSSSSGAGNSNPNPSGINPGQGGPPQ